MGKIAQDYVEGHCCSRCMYYFDFKGEEPWESGGHGYPVMCEECWKEEPKKNKDFPVILGEKTGITKDGIQEAIFN